jgi:GcrA cell cycle regulator
MRSNQQRKPRVAVGGIWGILIVNDLPSHASAEKMPWTEDRVEQLKKFWADGLSASQIAAKLGMGVTRNAVIGKVHRLNLAGRATQPRNTASRQPRVSRGPSSRPHAPSMPTAGSAALRAMPRSESAPRPLPLPEPKPLRLVDLPKDGRITILHLSDKTCRWPIGDPGTEEFCFCGHGPRDGSPYCEYHARIAYQPAQERRMRRAS